MSIKNRLDRIEQALAAKYGGAAKEGKTFTLAEWVQLAIDLEQLDYGRQVTPTAELELRTREWLEQPEGDREPIDYGELAEAIAAERELYQRADESTKTPTAGSPAEQET